MKYFWEGYIHPILRLLRPRHIVEIGSAQGWNTHNLLRYISFSRRRLTIIDPSPMFDVQAVQEQHGERFQPLLDISLHALPKIEQCDVVLIDGDHNWYTVYHELQLLTKIDPFPVVLFHDVEWPYARRDMYYFPETIPETFRHEYANLGVRRGHSQLTEDGMNASFCNAITEGGARNGVLTAVEDFLQQTELPLSYYHVAKQYGLGILVAGATSRQRRLIEYLNKQPSIERR
ncbi:class I SAM-dependent methyltransferase [Paenibacillus agilis]|uniref:Class I SAM-dependent methyltransferase n=1 Tax=Paenibacillus agilis TaxID=3020863 RepID=A0A559IKQ2_9BACL|nr:class I SAM-dependent methyltransferase [Paenibacillus agilis]TVX88053.1 class I SAM-dependent methyltransferase [Paenibacillus agilis]